MENDQHSQLHTNVGTEKGEEDIIVRMTGVILLRRKFRPNPGRHYNPNIYIYIAAQYKIKSWVNIMYYTKEYWG